MNKVFAVAKYILDKKNDITAMKLQKLIYYCQAWSLYWDEEELFEEDIQAWANGPIVPSLYEKHKGMFKIGGRLFEEDLEIAKLNETEIETIDKILEFYGDKSAQWLTDLIVQEEPWRLARVGLSRGERGTQVISKASMCEYYGSL